MENFKVYSAPRVFYNSMLKDILNAKRKVYLETYIYNDDYIGKLFREALYKKVKEGVRVKILVDAWGSSAKKDFFKKIVNSGGRVRFFREFKYVVRVFTKNHERNHRKLLIVDDKIVYLGSANITAKCLDWRELVLRINGSSARAFRSSFLRSWRSAGKITRRKIKYYLNKGFEIVEDFPHNIERAAEKKYIHLIKRAKKNIFIETPFFIPSKKIRRALQRAVRRKVKVDIILPYISDVRVVDIARNAYLGDLHNKGINIHYYKKSKLHSKLMIVDDSFFILGSSNLDYRSFIHQYDINLTGNDKKLIGELKKYFLESLKHSEPFSYDEWKRRSSFGKIIEIIFYYFRRYL